MEDLPWPPTDPRSFAWNPGYPLIPFENVKSWGIGANTTIFLTNQVGDPNSPNDYLDIFPNMVLVLIEPDGTMVKTLVFSYNNMFYPPLPPGTDRAAIEAITSGRARPPGFPFGRNYY